MYFHLLQHNFVVITWQVATQKHFRFPICFIVCCNSKSYFQSLMMSIQLDNPTLAAKHFNLFLWHQYIVGMLNFSVFSPFVVSVLLEVTVNWKFIRTKVVIFSIRVKWLAYFQNWKSLLLIKITQNWLFNLGRSAIQNWCAIFQSESILSATC